MIRSAERITLIETPAPWSKACLEALQTSGFEAVLQDPNEALFAETVKGNLFVVPVSHFGSERFDLVRQIGELGGTSIVLAGSNTADVTMKCWTINRTFCAGQKSLDFTPLIAVANLLK